MTITKRIPSGTPASAATPRVTGTPTGGVQNTTERIRHLIELEGDQAGGFLLVEGDMQESGSDALKLEGDQATVGSVVTKRIPEAV